MAYVTPAPVIAKRRAVPRVAPARRGMGAVPYVAHQFPGDGLGFALPAAASIVGGVVHGVESLFGGGKPNPRPAIAARLLGCVQQYGDVDAARIILNESRVGATAEGKAAYQAAWQTIQSQYQAIAAAAQAAGPLAGQAAQHTCTATGNAAILANPHPVVQQAVPVLVNRQIAATNALATINQQIPQVQQQIATVQQVQQAAAAAGQAPPPEASAGVLTGLQNFLAQLTQKSAIAQDTVRTIDQGIQQLTSPVAPDQAAAQAAALEEKTRHADSLFGSSSTTLLLVGAGLVGAILLTGRRRR